MLTKRKGCEKSLIIDHINNNDTLNSLSKQINLYTSVGLYYQIF